MKRLILTVMMSTLILLVACTPSVVDEKKAVISEVAPTRKITLEDAPDILNLSLLLPSRFEHLDAASEGMSNEDMELGPDASEVQLFLSDEPFQFIYCAFLILESRIEQAAWDMQLEDDNQMKSFIVENIKAGAEEEDIEVTIPSVEITHPEIGDSAILGEGYMESYGFHFGFDTCWFRDNTVYVIIFSLYMSADKVSLVPIAEEIEKRLNNYKH